MRHTDQSDFESQRDFEGWLRQQTKNDPAPEVPAEFLARQRRSIYRRMESPRRSWLARRWALSFAILLLLIAGGITLEHHYKTAPAVPVNAAAQVSDEQLFSDLSAMDQTNEPKAIQPMHGLFEE